MKSYKLIHNCPECGQNTRRIVPDDIDYKDLDFNCPHCGQEIDTWQQLVTTYPTPWPANNDMYSVDGSLRMCFYSRGQYWWMDETYTICGPFFYESEALRLAEPHWKWLNNEEDSHVSG